MWVILSVEWQKEYLKYYANQASTVAVNDYICKKPILHSRNSDYKHTKIIYYQNIVLQIGK